MIIKKLYCNIYKIFQKLFLENKFNYQFIFYLCFNYKMLYLNNKNNIHYYLISEKYY